MDLSTLPIIIFIDVLWTIYAIDIKLSDDLISSKKAPASVTSTKSRRATFLNSNPVKSSFDLYALKPVFDLTMAHLSPQIGP